jgi:hypothetical protein
LYGLAFALMSGVLLALYNRARTARLAPALNPYERAGVNAEVEAWAVIGGFGASSAVLSLALPKNLLPLAVWLYASMAVVMPLLSRRWRRQGDAALASMQTGV